MHSSGNPMCPLDIHEDGLLSNLMLGHGAPNVIEGPLKLTADFTKSLRVMPPLPKKIHLSWVDKDVLNSSHEFVRIMNSCFWYRLLDRNAVHCWVKSCIDWYIAWHTSHCIPSIAVFVQVRCGIGNLTASNPDWTTRIWDDEDIENYLKLRLAPHDYNLLKHRHIVEKSDIWRLLVLYHDGGYYQDIDRL